MGRTQLNIRLSEDDKAEWQEYAEKARWCDHTTDFVKKAVREKIERIDREGPNRDFEIPQPDVSGADSGEVLERLQDLRNDMQDLQADVSQAVDAVHAQSGVDPDLAPDIYQALPVGEEDALTAKDIGNATGNRVAAVRFALENLRQSDGMGVRKVVELEHDGERFLVEGDGENVEGYRTNTAPRWYKAEGA